MVRNFWSIWIMFFCLFFYNVIKVNHILYRSNILLHLISSLLLTKSLLVPCAYASIESIDCIILSSFELKAILLISSVKTLCFSLLNLFCIFNIDLLFFINSLWFFWYCLHQICFFLDGLFYSQVELLLNSFIVPFSFLSSLPSSIK